MFFKIFITVNMSSAASVLVVEREYHNQQTPIKKGPMECGKYPELSGSISSSDYYWHVKIPCIVVTRLVSTMVDPRV